ncbi:hypothetical protein [Salibacterium halotolerans]|uniref:hypothetical protein n=1 Tax=Salibacterium halotolerans TaxID=1884432 RepID=UPI0014817DBA|nr:hypothetical protein [Salibacterium halotolerans]
MIDGTALVSMEVELVYTIKLAQTDSVHGRLAGATNAEFEHDSVHGTHSGGH